MPNGVGVRKIFEKLRCGNYERLVQVDHSNYYFKLFKIYVGARFKVRPDPRPT